MFLLKPFTKIAEMAQLLPPPQKKKKKNMATIAKNRKIFKRILLKCSS